MTTIREQALLLRLAAADVANEAQSRFVLRRTLRDLGWTDAAMDATVERVCAEMRTVRTTPAPMTFEAAA